MKRERGIGGLVVAGVLLVAVVALAALVVKRPFSDTASLARHHGPHRTLPRPHRTPKPSPEATPVHEQSGHTGGTGSSSAGQTITEHHDIHTHGSVAVVSGTVDDGTGGAESKGSQVGPPIKKKH